MMFQFSHPFYFFLLIPVAAAAAWIYRRRVRSGLLFAPTRRIPARGVTWRARVAALLPALYVAALVLIVLALARPRAVFSVSRQRTDAIAVEMVVDVSGSMEAMDLSERTPTGVKTRTRLDAVKETFAQFVEKRPDDLIGLISFGGYAVTRAPLTTDTSALLHVLGGIEIPKQSVDADGRIVNQEELLTAVGDALATACARLADAEPKSRIIVLLSDGESNTGIIKPDEAATMAKRLGIKVYTIGIGATGRAPFRVRDIFGRDTIQYAEVTLDEALLRRIASETGGAYYNVRDPKGLEAAMKRIDALEKTEIERECYQHYDEFFPRFLAPAAVLLALACGLNMAAARRIV
jgi:Ca-activated chloride channel family protein